MIKQKTQHERNVVNEFLIRIIDRVVFGGFERGGRGGGVRKFNQNDVIWFFLVMFEGLRWKKTIFYP